MANDLENTPLLAGPAYEQNGIGAGKVNHGHRVGPGRLNGRVVVEVRPCVRVWHLTDGLELEVVRVMEA